MNYVYIQKCMVSLYAKQYGLLETAGSDNHWGSNVFRKLREKGYRPEIAGMETDTEICCAEDFIRQVKLGTMRLFLMDAPTLSDTGIKTF